MFHEVSKDDIYRSWLMAVIETYEQIRASVPGLRGMKTPGFAIDGGFTRSLGRWEADRRLIRLSVELFERSTWSEVVAVLKHEMAHQAVTEVYQEPDEPDHGPAFQRACRLLGVKPDATRPWVEGETPPVKVVERVQKLLALGTSPNHHEAELALKKAHELMLRHNLQQLDVSYTPRYNFRPVGKPYRKIPGYVWHILNIVGDFYFVQYICRLYDDKHGHFDGGRWRVLELYGSPENLDLAEYVFYFLLRQGHAEWDAYRRAKPEVHGRLKRSFLDGVFIGFRQTLETQRDELERSEALIWSGDPALESYFQARNPTVRRRSVRALVDQRTHADGIEVGSKMRMRPGMSDGGGKGGVRGLLS